MGGDQFAGVATALFVGGNGEASLVFLAFFFLLFFLVPSDAWSPLSLGDCFSCFPTVVPLVVVVVAATKSALASFLAFFFNFFFFFFASPSTLIGPWMADSWKMSEADTAASRHRCLSSSLSSLLQGEGTEWAQGPEPPLTALGHSHQEEATAGGGQRAPAWE